MHCRPNRQRPSLFFLLAAAAVGVSPAYAQEATAIHGRVELTDRAIFFQDSSFADMLGEQAANDVLGDLRLTYAPRWGAWDFNLHYVATADNGGAVRLARAEAAYFDDPPAATLFDLSDVINDSGKTLVTHRIDRLSLGYSTDKLVLRVGHQALTWGSGIVFHPMDLIDPFSPDAIDTEYKPGVDLGYLQWLFDDGSDLQVIAVPRAYSQGDAPEWDASTLAVHYHQAIGEIGATWLLARDHGDWTAGLGLSGPLGGAVWNTELVPTFEADGKTRVSGLVNITNAMTLLKRNATVFAEYFHNGFGADNASTAYDTLPADLADRLARGQVFNVSQDYLAGGISLEWTPLLTLSPSLIFNLNDGSAYATAEATWSLSDNTNMIFGAQMPTGPHGSEYDGLPLSGNGPPYIAPPTTLYVQLRHYF